MDGNVAGMDSFFVLIADDSQDDRFLLRNALKKVPRLQVTAEVPDGTDVIAYLKGRGRFTDRKTFPVPHLLLLDLKMPVKDGFEVLVWLQKQKFDDLTVVVLTDSMHPDHIKKALDLGADLFQLKPRSLQERQTMVQALETLLMEGSIRASLLPERRNLL